MPASPETMITYLIRHGAVPEVVKGGWDGVQPLRRGTQVVAQTHRGLCLGTILEALRSPQEPQQSPEAPTSQILREATETDLHQQAERLRRARDEFPEWEKRIADWGLDLQLIDLEWTLDGEKRVLYVLNERGPECTKLALQAAAAGLGIIEVQPVSLDGLVTVDAGGGGGCGSCGHH